MSVPAESKLVDLLIDVKSGFACGEEVSDGVFQVRMNNISRNGDLDLTKRRRVPRSNRAIDKSWLQDGDVLFNATNSPDLVGKTAFIRDLDEPAVFSNHFLRLRTKPNAIDPEYLARWLQLQFSHGTFRSICRQWVNQATVSKESLLGLSVPLLPFDAQERAVAAMNQIDTLRTKRRAAIALLDDLAQSIFFDMFGDPAHNQMRWPTTTLGAIGDVQGGLQVTASRKTNPVELPYLRVANVYRRKLDLSEIKSIRVTHSEMLRTTLQPGDVLIVEGHGNQTEIGRAAVWDGSITQCTHQNHLIRFRPSDRVLPAYVDHFINSASGRQHLLNRARTTSGLNTISTTTVKSTPINLPPADLQETFSRRMQTIDRTVATHQAHLAELDALFASVQDRAFRGELFADVSSAV